MNNLINLENFQTNLDNLFIVKTIKKLKFKHINMLLLINMLIISIEHYYFIPHSIKIYNHVNIILNISIVITLLIFNIIYCYNNYMKVNCHQLHDYLNILSDNSNSPTSAFIHDLKNIVFSLSNHMHFQNYDKAKQKIDTLCTMVRTVNLQGATGIYCIDRLLSSKLKNMDKLNIKFDIVNDLTCPVTIDNLDLCILIGNSLDNAIEACSKIPSVQDRYINLALSNNQDFLEINICNSTINNNPVSLKTSKLNKKYHGFGLKNIKSVLKKHDGKLYIEQFKNNFNLSMNLRLPLQNSKH